jgi:DNA (cytosine-5)-methyltransferase 1
LISSVGDSPAKTLASLGNERELMANVAGFGVHTREPLTYFDRTSLSWRTSQGSLLVGSDVFSETWPNAGTMRNGTVYARPTSVLRIGESGSSLLPTPNASDWQSICWHRCERLIRGLNGREAGAKGGCMNLQDSMAAGWMLHQKLASRPPRGNMPRVNPSYWEFLMGFAVGWTALEPLEMQSFRKSRSGSGRKS